MKSCILGTVMAVMICLGSPAAAQDVIDFSMVPKAGQSARASVEIRIEGELRLSAEGAKPEKFKAAADLEFVDLIEESGGKGVFKGKRRYLRWTRDWNKLAIDPEQAGALFVLSTDGKKLSAEGVDIESGITEDCQRAEAGGVQALGGALEYLKWASTGEINELDVVPLAQFMMGTGCEIAEAKGEFKLLETDGKTARLGGWTIVKYQDRVLNEMMNWSWGLDAEYVIDLQKGQFLSIVWSGEGKMQGGRGHEAMEGTARLTATAGFVPGAEVAKDLTENKAKLRTVSRLVGGTGLVLEIPSDWTPVSFETLGEGYAPARETKEAGKLAVAVVMKPAAGGGKNAKRALDAVKKIMAEEGFRMKSCRSPLGAGLTGEIETDEGYMIVDCYIVDGRVLRISCLTSKAGKSNAKSVYTKIRKSLRSL